MAGLQNIFLDNVEVKPTNEFRYRQPIWMDGHSPV
jgi:hypothetical protein